MWDAIVYAMVKSLVVTVVLTAEAVGKGIRSAIELLEELRPRK